MGANRPLIRFIGFAVVTFTILSLRSNTMARQAAQQPSSASKRVALNVLALDSQGNPVSDLSADDFRISDQGKPQRIVSFTRTGDPKPLATPSNAAGEAVPAPRPIVILLDLLNDNLSNRAFAENEINRALEHMEASDFLYLYLLTNEGQVYPIHPVPAGPAEASPEKTPWTAHIRPLLENAINRVYGLRPMDESQMNIRVESTYKALDLLASVMPPVAGPKNIIWITHGITTIIRLVNGEPYDYSPRLQRLATAIDRAGIAVNIVDEGSEVGSGNLSTLEQLTELTGGQLYKGVDKAISAVMAAGRSGYRIEYLQPVTDDKFHKIRVVCARKGVRVQAKQGYYAYR